MFSELKRVDPSAPTKVPLETDLEQCYGAEIGVELLACLSSCVANHQPHTAIQTLLPTLFSQPPWRKNLGNET